MGHRRARGGTDSCSSRHRATPRCESLTSWWVIHSASLAEGGTRARSAQRAAQLNARSAREPLQAVVGRHLRHCGKRLTRSSLLQRKERGEDSSLLSFSECFTRCATSPVVTLAFDHGLAIKPSTLLLRDALIVLRLFDVQSQRTGQISLGLNLEVGLLAPPPCRLPACCTMWRTKSSPRLCCNSPAASSLHIGCSSLPQRCMWDLWLSVC